MHNTLAIMQHNVLNWPTRKHELIKIYSQTDPEIILINSHGTQDNINIKIPGFLIHQKKMLTPNITVDLP